MVMRYEPRTAGWGAFALPHYFAPAQRGEIRQNIDIWVIFLLSKFLLWSSLFTIGRYFGRNYFNLGRLFSKVFFYWTKFSEDLGEFQTIRSHCFEECGHQIRFLQEDAVHKIEYFAEIRTWNHWLRWSHAICLLWLVKKLADGIRTPYPRDVSDCSI